MRKSLLAAIMAASALIPATAMAQDNPDRPERGEGRPQRQATPGAEGRTQWQRPQGQPAAPAQAQARPQVQAAAPVQAQQQRPDRGGRPDAANGGRNFGGRGDFRGQPQVQGAAPQAQVRGDVNVQRGNRPDDQRSGRPDFNGQQRGGDPRADGRGYPQNGRGPDFRGNVGRGQDFRGNDGRGPDYRGNDGRGNAGGYNNANRNWSRDWRRDNRYNYNAYRVQNRNAYHLPRYYAPYGWNGGYRRFSIGFSLNSVLFDQNYWIEDTDYYRLPPAYGPYRWVRYYNDALLVDIRTGYVVDTVYDIFW